MEKITDSSIVSFVVKLPQDFSSIKRGWGNGYVAVGKDHMLYGVHYNNIDVIVHGGLTFSKRLDYGIIENMNIDPMYEGMWAIGFYTTCFKDDLETWPEEKVKEETRLLEQAIINGDYSILIDEKEILEENIARQPAERTHRFVEKQAVEILIAQYKMKGDAEAYKAVIKDLEALIGIAPSLTCCYCKEQAPMVQHFDSKAGSFDYYRCETCDHTFIKEHV